ncbi:exodeoxyribonuclease VII small subunit [Candidatus Aerophobetes bacterium]|uniref:Exodeoxyribonuclease 7 small subunit n=1 Tax=Aerophobetes bacterium TaxID=2030807 RepID=A0A662DJJ2_UNCAE|nr:MAG: exodeoxyribonuclease VII small subunit [Candidatus Aerophobetes bacterium]
MNFEEAMQKLEKITQDLEEGNLPLEESLKKFEEGMRLVNFCEKKLEEVEKRIKILIKEEDKLRLESWQPVEEKEENKSDNEV